MERGSPDPPSPDVTSGDKERIDPRLPRVRRPDECGSEGPQGGVEKWCPGTESNRRHEDFQSSALPTELPGRKVKILLKKSGESRLRASFCPARRTFSR